MRFQVPQFIEIEDKIFGPLTIKQFIYLVGGAGVAYILYAILPWFLSYLLIPIALAFAAALAFYKINGKPFINTVEAAFTYAVNHKLYIWRKKDKKITPKEIEKKQSIASWNVPRLSESKLKDLSWSLDINEKTEGTIYSPKNQTFEKRKTFSNPF